jgi:SAM-dependent methyltransferase
MNLIPIDDLYLQAREGWRLGKALCRSCGGYHQVWGLLRASGVVGATLVDGETLGPLLDDCLAPDQSVLIAGAADAGLLQFIAASASARPLKVRVVDRCPAPLALLEAIAIPSGISLTTGKADLTRLDEPDAHDLILSHSMLYFIDPEGRLEVLRRLRSALAPGGRLVLVLRLSAPENFTEESHRQAWLARVHSRLALHPDLAAMAGDGLDPVLETYARARAVRLSAYATPGEVEDVLSQSGLSLVRHVVSGMSTSLWMEGRVNSRQSHIFVAKAA